MLSLTGSYLAFFDGCFFSHTRTLFFPLGCRFVSIDCSFGSVEARRYYIQRATFMAFHIFVFGSRSHSFDLLNLHSSRGIDLPGQNCHSWCLFFGRFYSRFGDTSHPISECDKENK